MRSSRFNKQNKNSESALLFGLISLCCHRTTNSKIVVSSIIAIVATLFPWEILVQTDESLTFMLSQNV